MKSKIHTEVQIYLDNVTLSISVKEDLSKEDGKITNFGYVQVSNGAIGGKECFWDNISYFFDISRKKFKKEVREELEQKGYNWEEIYKTIKRLIKRARKLNLIVE